MQVLFKTILVLLFVIPLAIYVGYLAGDEDYTAVIAIIGGILSVGAYALLGSKVRIEAFALTVLLCAYYIGGKATAVLTLGGPLFLGEVVLALATICFVIRYALTREWPEKTALTLPLLAMLVYSAIHLWFDYRSYGLLAIRDSAAAYYSLFFFFGLCISNHPPSVDFLTTWLIRALVFACLIVHPLILLLTPLNRFEIGDHIIIAHTSDTVGVSYLAVCALSYLKAKRSGQFQVLFYLLSFGCLAFAVLQGRSTYTLAILVLMAYLWLVGSKGFAIGISAAVVVAVMLATIAVQTGKIDQDAGKVGYVAAHMAALVTPVVGSSGSREGINIGQETIEWRLTWWEYLASETWHEDPLFGLGLGRDITAGFLDIYSGPTYQASEEGGVRSPHSILFTFIGRLGYLGAAIFLMVSGAFVFKVRESLQDVWDDRDRSLWCLVLMIFVSAFFGVVLEGPNGAIPFWLILGILSGKMAKREAVRSLERRKLAPGLVKARHHRPELRPVFS